MENRNSLLTVKEVAAWLRLSLAETYKLVQSHAIVHYRVGPGRGAIRIEEKDVTTFLETRRVGKPIAIGRRSLIIVIACLFAGFAE